MHGGCEREIWEDKVGYERLEVRLEQRPCALWLHTILSSSHQGFKGPEGYKYEPLGEELKDLVLAFLGKPSLSRDIQLYLLKIDLENFGRKVSHKVLRKRPVFFL